MTFLRVCTRQRVRSASISLRHTDVTGNEILYLMGGDILYVMHREIQYLIDGDIQYVITDYLLTPSIGIPKADL